MSEKNINAPCRERSNESNIMGRCMRCSAELGKACGAASSCCSAGGEEEPAMNKIVGPRGWTPGNLERRFTETHPSSYDKKMRCALIADPTAALSECKAGPHGACADSTRLTWTGVTCVRVTEVRSRPRGAGRADFKGAQAGRRPYRSAPCGGNLLLRRRDVSDADV
jgi:hypothetical protein